MTVKVSPFDAAFRLFCVLLRMRNFDGITTPGLKSDAIFEFSAPIFL